MLAILCATSSNPAVLASKDVPVFFVSINGSGSLRRFRSTFSAFAHVQHVPAVTNATTADWMVRFDRYRRLLAEHAVELGCAVARERDRRRAPLRGAAKWQSSWRTTSAPARSAGGRGGRCSMRREVTIGGTSSEHTSASLARTGQLTKAPSARTRCCRFRRRGRGTPPTAPKTASDRGVHGLPRRRHHRQYHRLPLGSTALDATRATRWRRRSGLCTRGCRHPPTTTPLSSRPVPPVTTGAGAASEALTCVLRESSYSYCGNPLRLTQAANDRLMDNLYGAWWVAPCARVAAGGASGGGAALKVGALRDPRFGRRVATARPRAPHLATGDVALITSGVARGGARCRSRSRRWLRFGRRRATPNAPTTGGANFLFDVDAPQEWIDDQLRLWLRSLEKNWMPFEDDGRLLALRWFAPHTVVEIDPDSGRCTQAHRTGTTRLGRAPTSRRRAATCATRAAAAAAAGSSLRSCGCASAGGSARPSSSATTRICCTSSTRRRRTRCAASRRAVHAAVVRPASCTCGSRWSSRSSSPPTAATCWCRLELPRAARRSPTPRPADAPNAERRRLIASNLDSLPT